MEKQPGIDEIQAEILKADVEITANAFLPLFVNVWIDETLPADWMQGIIVKIPKKGDLSECRNWRGINHSQHSQQSLHKGHSQ